MNYRIFSTCNIDYLNQWKKNINWDYLSLNENDDILNYMNENLNKINWKNICKNKNVKAIDLLNKHWKKHIMEIDFFELSCNPNANNFFDNPEKYKYIDILGFIENSCSYSIDYIEIYMKLNNITIETIPIQIVQNKYAEKYISHIYKNIMSYSFVKQNMFWYCLSCNTCSFAVSLCFQNKERIDWELFSKNPGIIAFIENNKDTFLKYMCFHTISFNPNLLEIMKLSCFSLNEIEFIKNGIIDNLDTDLFAKYADENNILYINIKSIIVDIDSLL